MLNPQQIRRALVKLAEFKQREHYTPLAVQYIIANFNEHPLRDAIIYFADNDPKEYMARLAELRSVCRSRYLMERMYQETGIDVREILRGDTLITNAVWIKLREHFDLIESLEERQR